MVDKLAEKARVVTEEEKLQFKLARVGEWAYKIIKAEERIDWMMTIVGFILVLIFFVFSFLSGIKTNKELEFGIVLGTFFGVGLSLIMFGICAVFSSILQTALIEGFI